MTPALGGALAKSGADGLAGGDDAGAGGALAKSGADGLAGGAMTPALGGALAPSGADTACGPAILSPMRVGIDLVAVQAVREAIDAHAGRYLRRVYTERELADCASPTGVDPERLAGRFAAKEATVKVLRPGDVGLPLSSIEVRRSEGGWVELALSGAAAELAAAQGLGELALSISHEASFATAIVVASVAGFKIDSEDPMHAP
jgi:holo-[acyl-carrier protein] synthase